MVAKDSSKQKEYREHIQAAIRYARKVQWPRCKVLRAYWAVSHVSDDVPANSEFVTSAVIKPVVEAQVAALVPRNPKTRVIPRKQYFDSNHGKVVAEKSIKLIEKVSDYDIEQVNAREEWKRAVRDGQLLGMGATFTGWNPWIKESPVVKRTLDVGEGKEEKTETNLRYQEYIRKAAPFLRYKRTEDVLLPAYCQRAEDAPYMILMNWRLLSEVKADPNYDIPDDKDFAAGSTLTWMTDDSRPAYDADSQDSVGYSKMVCEYHYFHKADDVYAVFIDGVDEPVRWDDTWPVPGGAESIDGFPIKLFIPLPQDGNPYGLPPALDLVPQQQELNSLRSKMADKVKKWKDITLVDDDANPADVDKIKRAEEWALVSVQNAKNYVPMQSMMDSLNALLAYEQRIREDVRIQSKVTDFQMATAPNSNFATDSALLAQAGAASVKDQQVTVYRFMAEGAKCMFQHRQQLTPAEESVRITGERGVEWLGYTKDNIVGEYDFSMEIEDAPNDRVAARDDARMEMEAMYGKPEVDGTLLLRDVAKKLRIPEEVIRGTANFAAKREAEYENEILKTPLGEVVKPHPEENFEVHMMSHTDALQREQAMGMVNPALVKHLEETNAMMQITFGEQGKGGKPLVNAATGQQRTTGTINEASPQDKLRSGDVGSLRGMA